MITYRKKIRIASVEQNRMSTLLINLMIPKEDPHRTPLNFDDSSDDNSDDDM